MVSKRNSIVLWAVAAVFSFLTVVYVSCSKPGKIESCNGAICENGGYCHMDTLTKKPKCVCPTGFEGTTCASAVVSKYIGNWNNKQTIVGSDSTEHNGEVSNYVIFLKKSATPTTFLIDNFFNNSFYNGIVCTIDSNDSRHFIIDTLSTFHMVYDHFTMMWGDGHIAANDSAIDAYFCIRFKNQTTNWQVDTVTLHLTPHQL